MSLNIRHRNCVVVLCVFFLCLWARNAVCTMLYVPLIRAGMRDTCMKPDVEFTVFTVFKIVFYQILIMPWIKFITKTDYVSRL